MARKLLTFLLDRLESMLQGYKQGTRAADYTALVSLAGEIGILLFAWLKGK